jgi:hypothetical protein
LTVFLLKTRITLRVSRGPRMLSPALFKSFRKIMFSHSIVWMIGLFGFGLCLPAQVSAQNPNCVFATYEEYKCMDSLTHCSQQILLKACTGGPSTFCCTSTGYFTPCCGVPYQNAANDYPCGGSQCSAGGDIVDPASGRISKACFNSVKTAQKTQPSDNKKVSLDKTDKSSRK